MATETKLICPECEGATRPGKYDATFRLLDGDPKDERSLFGIPSSLCVECRQLYVDKDLIDLLGLRAYRCTFAILSDTSYRASA